MCHYTHLTPFEREKILFFLAEGKSITEIAHLLKRSKSTIYRAIHPRGPAESVRGFCGSSSRRTRTSRIHQRSTSKGSTMS